MLAAPIFLGLVAAADFGFLHWPKGPVRGAVVVCPPLAYEEVCAHTALRRLSESLAESGLVVLRIDYDGTGNSVRSRDDVTRVEAWTETIVDGVAQLAAVGLPSVTLVGLRFGATLAAAAAERNDAISGLVLWDPIVSGRRYVRMMRIFSAVGGDEPKSEDGVSVGGVEFDSPTLTAMGKTRVAVDQLTLPSLIIARAEADGDAESLAEAASGPDVEVRALEGTSGLLDTDAELARVPDQILREITTWVRDRASSPIDPQPEQPSFPSEATEVRDDVVLHHHATHVGPSQLFAIQTVREGANPTAAVVTLNNGLARSIGPGGAWIDLAACLAADGLRVVRLDLSGLGDSPARPGRLENDDYPPTAAQDIGELIEQLGRDGVKRIALVGLCSGALVSFDAALAHPEVEVLIGINGRFDKPFHDRRADRHGRASGQTNRLLAIPLSKTPLLRSFEKVPTWSWRLLDRTHLVASPTKAIEKVVARGVRVLLVFGPTEWGLGALRARGGKRFVGVASAPQTTLVEVPGLDHSMFESGGRTEVSGLVQQYLHGLAGDTEFPATQD